MVANSSVPRSATGRYRSRVASSSASLAATREMRPCGRETENQCARSTAYSSFKHDLKASRTKMSRF